MHRRRPPAVVLEDLRVAIQPFGEVGVVAVDEDHGAPLVFGVRREIGVDRCYEGGFPGEGSPGDRDEVGVEVRRVFGGERHRAELALEAAPRPRKRRRSEDRPAPCRRPAGHQPAGAWSRPGSPWTVPSPPGRSETKVRPPRGPHEARTLAADRRRKRRRLPVAARTIGDSLRTSSRRIRRLSSPAPEARRPRVVAKAIATGENGPDAATRDRMMNCAISFEATASTRLDRGCAAAC